MNSVFLFSLLSFVSLAACMPNGRSLLPHNVVQFGNMISCATGLNQFKALRDYEGYGCYCGLGGSGTALDETDQCCVEHDQCYDDVMKSGLCLAENQVYAIIYDYEWDNCATEKASITCKKAADYTDHDWPVCAARMCECDRVGALCFAAKRKTFDEAYRNYDKSQC